MNAPLHSLPPDLDPSQDPLFVVEGDKPRGVDLLSQLANLITIVARRWLVVLATIVVCVAASALAIKTLQPRWRASATLLLNISGAQVLDKVQGVGEDGDDRRSGYRAYYETQRQILASRAVAQRALAELGLAHDPQFLGVAGVKSPAERTRRSAAIDPVERLQEMITVSEIRDSRLVKVEAEYPDAEVSAQIANAIADAYLGYIDSSRSRVGTTAQQDIAKEKAQAQQRVLAAEKAFERFKRTHRLSSIEQHGAHSAQGIAALNGHSKDVEAERIRLESMLSEAKRLHAAGNLSAANLLTESDRSLFKSMREERIEAERAFAEVDVKYGPKHEEHRKAAGRVALIEKKVQREGAELIESLQAKVNVATQAEHKLNRSLGREKAQALRVTDLEREYRALEREATAAEENYLLISRRDTEIAITNRVDDQGIEILDRATVPTAAIFPKTIVLVLCGIGVGIGFGILLALSIDFRDQRIRSVADLQRAVGAFGLPVLGRMPRLPADSRLGAGNARGQRRQRDLYAHLFPHSLMAERCRGLRTSLSFGAVGQKTLRSLMVTSPRASEGKSSIALNLALSFCQANKRVVLIDADMRRPRIHQVFADAAGAANAGLAAVLQGQCAVTDALIPVPQDAPPGLSILPCGEVPDNPAELIDTPKFRQLLVELQSQCDLVIVDCPPVLPVTDPLIIARHVDGVVIVGRCGATTRDDIAAAIAQLARGDTNVLGVVLNQVDPRRDQSSYTSEYYAYRAANAHPEPA